MRKLLIYDTETRGLPIDYQASFQDTANWPRIIQLAWELCYENGDTIAKSCELVNPDGWEMPSKEYFMRKGVSEEKALKSANFWIEHGYTQEESMAKGKPIAELLLELAKVMNKADVIVAHNAGYDKPIVECEFYRAEIYPKRVRREHPSPDNRPEGVRLKHECTKLLSMPICKILLGTRGDYKWPSLAEAYFFMFRKEVENAHDAGADVQACKEIYLWIQEYNFMQELI